MMLRDLINILTKELNEKGNLEVFVDTGIYGYKDLFIKNENIDWNDDYGDIVIGVIIEPI